MSRLIHSSLLMLVLAVVFYAALALYADGALVWQAITSLDPLVWLVILLLSLANYLLRYWRWHWFIAHGERPALSHRRHLAIYIAGFSLTMTPGKAGEGMRSLYLKRHGISHARSFAALFVKRIMDLLAILVLAGFGLSALLDDRVWLAAGLTLLIIAACLVMVHMPADRWLTAGWTRHLPGRIVAVLQFVAVTLGNARDLLGWRFLLAGLAIGVLAWGLEGYGLFLVMQEYRPDQVSVLMAMAVYGLGVLLGALSMSPGGLGASEFAIAWLLHKIGFDMPSAIAITYICRLATLWFAVLIGVVTLSLMSLLGIRPQLPKEN